MNFVSPGLDPGPDPELVVARAGAAGDEFMSPRQVARLARDRQRGYSINVKQVVLAFAVEIVIIGLILTNTLLIVLQLPDASTPKIVQAMLFPIAMAMVETARVPLAIAVRTQTSLLVKLAALVGVLCAVAVTSNSLYSIGAASFSPRLEDTHRKEALLRELEEKQRLVEARIKSAEADRDQRIKERDALSNALSSLSHQLTEQPGQTCTTIQLPSPAPGAPAPTQQKCKDNPALKTLNGEITAAKGRLAEAEAALKQAQTQLQQAKDSTEVKDLQAELAKAEQAKGDSVFQSQLHSLAAMLFRVDPDKVTPAQIKTIEFYLVFVSSIAAAFSSTLIAMTSVRRLPAKQLQPSPELPDEAVSYLFGPLLVAMQKQAQDAVDAALARVKAPDKAVPS